MGGTADGSCRRPKSHHPGLAAARRSCDRNDPGCFARRRRWPSVRPGGMIAGTDQTDGAPATTIAAKTARFGSIKARRTKPREDVMRRGHLAVLLLSCFFSALASAAIAQEKPRYGGNLEVGTVHVTINALSWDQADWPWKFN